MKTKLFVSLLVFGMVISFQNCGGVKFTNGAASVANAKLVPMATETPVSGSVVDPGTSSSSIVDNPPPPPSTQVGNHTDDTSDGGCAKGGDKNSDDDNRKKMDEQDDSKDLVACILDGPGKSIKLGLIQDHFAGDQSVANSVCISRHACLDLVSKKFDVKEAEDGRGYCNGNPNVIRLDDKEVADLLQ